MYIGSLCLNCGEIVETLKSKILRLTACVLPRIIINSKTERPSTLTTVYVSQFNGVLPRGRKEEKMHTREQLLAVAKELDPICRVNGC